MHEYVRCWEKKKTYIKTYIKTQFSKSVVSGLQELWHLGQNMTKFKALIDETVSWPHMEVENPKAMDPQPHRKTQRGQTLRAVLRFSHWPGGKVVTERCCHAWHVWAQSAKIIMIHYCVLSFRFLDFLYAWTVASQESGGFSMPQNDGSTWLNHHNGNCDYLTSIKSPCPSPGSWTPQVGEAVKTTKAIASMMGQEDSAQHDFLKKCPWKSSMVFVQMENST